MEQSICNGLMDSIVIQAAKDYMEALCEKHKLEAKMKKCENMIQECQTFFTSDRFNIFTKLNGIALMEQLEKEVRANRYNKTKIYLLVE